MAYRNNLAKGDPVMHAETRRPGKVAAQPRESSRNVSVCWQGTVTPLYVDILLLRLVVDGKPEDVPPCDGAPPEYDETPSAPRAKPDSAVDALKRERDALSAEMTALEEKFRINKARRARLDSAIEVLSSPTP